MNSESSNTHVTLLQMYFQISFGPISWLMVSEIFPLRTRGRGISLAVLTNFGSNAIVTFAFSPLKVSAAGFSIFMTLSHIFPDTSICWICRSCWERRTYSSSLEPLRSYHFCLSFYMSRKRKVWVWKKLNPKSWNKKCQDRFMNSYITLHWRLSSQLDRTLTFAM